MSFNGYGVITASDRDFLKSIYGDRFTDSKAVREQYGADESIHAHPPPDAVAFPNSSAEIARTLAFCNSRRIPVIPFGAGTSLEGQILAPHGGLSLDVSGMDAILAVNAEDMDVTVEPGVCREDLNAYLRDTGLFFPVDPGANASIGGMASTRASGTNAVGYGTMREAVIGLTAILPDGREIRTGCRARKSAAGYDLTRLLVGSEGTLGVITSVTLRLHGRPENVAGAVVAFNTLEDAVNAVIEVLLHNIPIARIELLDAVQIRASNQYSKLSLAELPTLFLEFHGSAALVAEQSAMVSEICQNHHCATFTWADDPDERSNLWKARHDAAFAALAMRPGSKAIVSDVCVPISQLADCLLAARREMDEAGMIGVVTGHVGDGNFHAVMLVDPDDQAEVDKAYTVNRKIVEMALSRNGTCTGEHGIGLGKQNYLRQEFGEAVDVMALIKNAIDPNNIMNPGKVFAMDENPTGLAASKPVPYIRGLDIRHTPEIPQPLGLPIIQMGLNELPDGPPLCVVEAARDAITNGNRYGDPACRRLAEMVADANGISPDRLIFGNGSEELLDVVARVHVRAGDDVLISQFGYIQFDMIAHRIGAKVVKVPEVDFTASADNLLAAVTDRSKLVFLANPNNPTGTVMPEEDIYRLADGMPPTTLLVIDLAYGEFVGRDYCRRMHDLTRRRDNVVVTRTFSKAYGLAGFRVGWCEAPAWMIPSLYAARGVGSVNLIAQVAAEAILTQDNTVRDTIDRVAGERQRVGAALDKMGIDHLPSQTNFLLFRVRENNPRIAEQLVDFLFRTRGIRLRHTRETGLESFIRVTLGSKADNDTLIEGIRMFLHGEE